MCLGLRIVEEKKVKKRTTTALDVRVDFARKEEKQAKQWSQSWGEWQTKQVQHQKANDFASMKNEQIQQRLKTEQQGTEHPP